MEIKAQHTKLWQSHFRGSSHRVSIDSSVMTAQGIRFDYNSLSFVYVRGHLYNSGYIYFKGRRKRYWPLNIFGRKGVF